MEQGVGIAWVGDRGGALGAVVRDGKTQKLGSNGVGFDEIEAGKARDVIVVISSSRFWYLIPKSSTTKTKELRLGVRHDERGRERRFQ